MDLSMLMKFPTKLTILEGMIITTLLRKGLLNPSSVAALSVKPTCKPVICQFMGSTSNPSTSPMT
jgi:hypothetical protein